MEKLVFEADQLIEYEHKMCLYGQPPHIRAYQLVTMPEGCTVLFDEGQSFWHEASETPMPVAHLHKLLLGMLGAMESCDHYLLNVQRLQLSLATVQMDGVGCVRFMYLPFTSETGDDDHQLVVSFIQTLQRNSDKNCETSMSILQGLTIALGDKPFDLSTFRQRLMRMLGEAM